MEQAKSIVEQDKNFFTLGIGPAVGRLKTLASDAGAPGTNLIYFLGIMLTGLAGAGLVMRKRRKML